MHALDQLVLGQMLDDLARDDWAVNSGLVSEALCEALYIAAIERASAGDLRSAGVGASGQARSDIRNDLIHWLRMSEAAPAEQAFLTAMHKLLGAIKSEFHLALNAYEAHFACYEAGHFYKKHLDCIQGEPGREISTILFLNPNWKESDGGTLLIYKDAQAVGRILPQLGNFVMFRSAAIYHEVEAPKKTRFSLAGWMKKVDPTQAMLSDTLVPENA